MKKVIFWIAGVFVGLAILGAALGEESDDSSDIPPADGGAKVDGTPVEDVVVEEPDPVPDGDYAIASCDTGAAESLVGSVRIENTGEVPLVARVPFKWQIEDGSFIEAETAKETLEPGKSRLVFFKESVGIDTVLAFQGHPGYFDSTNCRSKVKIVN
jgi:hypothetical protein